MSTEFRHVLKQVEELRGRANGPAKRLLAFRVPPEIDNSVRSLAIHERVHISTLISLLLEVGLENYASLLREKDQISGGVLSPSDFRKLAEEHGCSVDRITVSDPIVVGEDGVGRVVSPEELG